MKKTHFSILCILLCLSLLGCVAAGDNASGETAGESTAATAPLVTETPVTETPATETVLETTVATQPPETQPATEAVQIPVEPFSKLKGLEQYNAVISKIKHPSLRVTYGDFAQIGEFIAAHFYDADEETERDYMKCYYHLRDVCGTEFMVLFDYADQAIVPRGEVVLFKDEIDPEDMRTTQINVPAVYDYGHYRYFYKNGALYMILWSADGIGYSVFPQRERGFVQHPLDREDSFISGLLKLETVEATIAQIDVFVD